MFHQRCSRKQSLKVCYDILFANTGDTCVLQGVLLQLNQHVSQNQLLSKKIVFVKQVDDDGTVGLLADI